MAMKYMKLFYDWNAMTGELDDASFGRLIRALLKYGSGGGDTELEGIERILYPVFRANIDRDMESYERRAEKCRESARLGGLARAANYDYRSDFLA